MPTTVLKISDSCVKSHADSKNTRSQRRRAADNPDAPFVFDTKMTGYREDGKRLNVNTT